LSYLAPCIAPCIALVAGFASLGCSSDSEDAAQQEADVQGGSFDTNVAHNYAVGITNEKGGVCSGTLIAPNLVLTARHCVVPPSEDSSVTCSDVFGDNVAPAALRVTTDPNLYRAKIAYAAREIIVPQNKAFCGNDIALLILTTSVPNRDAAPAIPVVQFKLTDRRLSGTITALGYGITTPSASDSGQRRVRQNIPLLCIPGSKIRDCTGDLAKFSDDPAEFVTGGYVCSGDSGSGAFDQESFGKGTPFVLGALSRGPDSKDKCLAGIYSRTDAHAALIVEAAKKAATYGQYDPPAWTMPVAPEVINDPSAEATCADVKCTSNGVAESTRAPSTSKTTITESGCSASPSRGAHESPTSLAAFGLALAASLVAARRRRSSPRLALLARNVTAHPIG